VLCRPAFDSRSDDALSIYAVQHLPVRRPDLTLATMDPRRQQRFDRLRTWLLLAKALEAVIRVTGERCKPSGLGCVWIQTTAASDTCHWSRTGCHTVNDCLRGQSFSSTWCIWRPRLRHWYNGGRTRTCHNACCNMKPKHWRRRQRTTAARRDREGRHTRHREISGVDGGTRPCHPEFRGISSDGHGTTHDRQLQHVHKNGCENPA
jgi:hypothetical protein